jgi:hypothetical protein
MSNRHRTVTAWCCGYFCTLLIGKWVGLPLVLLPAFIVLLLAPIVLVTIASQQIIRRVRSAFPDEWKRLRRDWLGLELRYFIYDNQTFNVSVSPTASSF